MKKLISLLVLFWTIYFGHAQTIGVSPNDSVYVTANVADEFDPVDAHIHVFNYLKGPVSYTWMMTDYTAPSQWELKLCDNNNCYDLLIGNPVHESLVVATGDSMDMKFQFSPHCVDGFGNANVVIYATGDSALTAINLNYQANLTTSCLNGISTITTSTITLYPNPVKQSFTVTGLPNTSGLTFEVIDMKGSVVACQIKANNNNVEISIPEAAAGEYVLKVLAQNGTIVATSKLHKVD